MEKLTNFSRIGLATGAALGMAHEVLTSPAEAAGPCQTLATRVVREFEDLGGVKDQYDSVIDKALEVIPGARVRYLIGSQVFEVVTDNRGYSERMIEALCTDNKIVATSEVTTPDGRRVEDQVILQNGRKENFRTWVVRKSPVAPVSPLVVPPRVPESPRTPEPPRPPVYGERNPWQVVVENWWMLPAAVLAGAGLIALSRLGHRRLGRAPQESLAAHGNIPVNARINTTPVNLEIDLNVNPTLRPVNNPQP